MKDWLEDYCWHKAVEGQELRGAIKSEKGDDSYACAD